MPFHRLRLCERQVEFVGVVLGVPAPSALDAHYDDYQDCLVFVVHAGKLGTVCGWRHYDVSGVTVQNHFMPTNPVCNGLVGPVK